MQFLSGFVLPVLVGNVWHRAQKGTTTILKWMEYGVYKEYTGVSSNIMFYLLQDGCTLEDPGMSRQGSWAPAWQWPSKHRGASVELVGLTSGFEIPRGSSFSISSSAGMEVSLKIRIFFLRVSKNQGALTYRPQAVGPFLQGHPQKDSQITETAMWGLEP